MIIFNEVMTISVESAKPKIMIMIIFNEVMTISVESAKPKIMINR
jgi:hypothetical protein